MDNRAARPFTGWIDTLAREHTRELTAMAIREGLTADESLDAVQEAYVTFLGLPQARSLAGSREDVAAFLAVIVRNAARNARRRSHRRLPHVEAQPESLSDDELAPDELIAEAEEHVAVLGCVQRLGEVQRAVVILRALEELSAEEVARSLELSPGHVRVLQHRAKAALRRCLDG